MVFFGLFFGYFTPKGDFVLWLVLQYCAGRACHSTRSPGAAILDSDDSVMDERL